MGQTIRITKPLFLTISKVMRAVAILILLLLCTSVVHAAQVTIDQEVVIPATSADYEGDDVIIDGVTVTIDGNHSFNSLQLINGAVITHSVETASIPYLQIATTITIDASSSINVTAKGQIPSTEVCNSCGGSHGGYGGDLGYASSNTPYGSYSEPMNLGTGGREGGSGMSTRGGGSIKIEANELILAGKILANGEDSRVENTDSGTGSGGSIWLDVGTLRGDAGGAARIQVNGGGGEYYPFGMGSGGRIAIYYSSLEDFDLASQVTAISKPSHYGYEGAAGTIYLKNKSTATEQLRVENWGFYGDLSRLDDFGSTPLGGALPDLVIKNANITQSADAMVDSVSMDRSVWKQSGHGLTINTAYDFSASALVQTGTLSLLGGNDLEVNAFTYVAGVDQNWTNIDVINGGNITTLEELTLILTADRITVDASSRIDISGKGQLPSSEVEENSGGSYGGYGGVNDNSTNAPYGNYLEPHDLGMGGRGNFSGLTTRGGGAIKIVADVLNLNGKILANGQKSPSFSHTSGSGGSIWLDVREFNANPNWNYGDPQIQAIGGELGCNATGSGGRIAIYYNTKHNFNLQIDDGDYQAAAYGGGSDDCGTVTGAPGTVYIRDKDVQNGELFILNKEGYSRDSATPLPGGNLPLIYAYLAKITQPSDVTSDSIELYGTSWIQEAGLTASTIYMEEGSWVQNHEVTLGRVIVDSNSTWMQNAALTLSNLHVGMSSNWYQGDVPLTVINSFSVEDSYFQQGGTLDLPGDDSQLAVDNYTHGFTADVSYERVEVRNGGTITSSVGQPITITANEVVVDISSKIDVSGKGQLPSAEVSFRCGGSYGGNGGIYSTGTTNAPYGSNLEPVDLGMGGNGGVGVGQRGGGAIKIAADLLELSGEILANGEGQSSAGTGSGGSIWLNLGVLRGDTEGDARISADGGDGSNYGTGSGGRIAIYYSSLENFDLGAQVTVESQSSSYSGESGTIHTEHRVSSTSVVSSDAQGEIHTATDRFRIEFINTIEPSTFTTEDVVLTGPSGAVPISSINSVSGVEYEIVLASLLTENGSYQLQVGPNISTPHGNGMDQDADGIEGEDPEDRYISSFVLDLPPPRVIDHFPYSNSYNNQTIDSISIGYSRYGSGVELDLNASSFVLLRDSVAVSGSVMGPFPLTCMEVAGPCEGLVYTPDTALLDGNYQFTVRLRDQAGHTTEGDYVWNFVLDRVPPAAPGVDALPPVTGVNQHTLTGTKEAYSAIVINGTQYGGNTASESWSATVALSEGANSFQVKARDRAGNISEGTDASIFYDNVPPGAVITLSGNGEGDGTHIQLNWSGYDEVANGNDIQRYDIYLSTTTFNDVSSMNSSANVPAGTFQYQFAGLERGTTYYIAVVAADQGGNTLSTVSPIAVTATDTIAPENPAGISVTDSQSTSLSITWQASPDSAGDLAGYRLYVDSEDAKELGSATLTHSLTGLDPATSYSLRISAIDGTGNESSGVSVIGVTIMPNPAGLSAVKGDSAVDLTWSHVLPQNQISSYAVYHSESDFSSVEGMIPSTTVAPGVATARIAGLTNDTNYYFAVTTINSSGGESKVVATISATPGVDDDGPELSELKFLGTTVIEGYELTQSGDFTVTAEDPAGVARVELLIDGESITIDSDDGDGILLPWDIAATTDGAHVLKLKARDNLGNESELSLNVTVAMPSPAAPTISSPSSGFITNQEQIQVLGTAEPNVEVQLLLEGAAAGEPVQSASDGSFILVADLIDGVNQISAVASNRGGAGDASTVITVTLDSSIPPMPYGLSALAGENGVISISWTPVIDSTVKGYDLYRSDVEFTDIVDAEKVNTNLLTAGRFDDLPATDGTYYYRVVSRNELGTASSPSLMETVASDRTQPRAEIIDYQPQGAYDSESGRIAPGRVNVEVTVNEVLLTTPFLSVTVDGGVPISIALEKQSDLVYVGHFDLSSSTKSGTAYAVFSARDLVGNRGTGIDQGGTLLFDTDGPVVTGLTLLPSSPVKNDSGEPQQVSVTLTLDQAVKEGSSPYLGYLLGTSPDEIAINGLTQISELTWQADFILPATAGAEPESLRFAFSALDDLDNHSTEIKAPNDFQVYQGDLPPLSAPTGLSAKALSGGKVEVNWNEVEDAAEYQLLRQAPGETELTDYQRITGLTYTDTTSEDGEYQYAIATVRQENSQESVSEHSAPVTVVADALVPDAPQGLTLELVGAGIQALWQEVAPVNDETISYNIYRSDDPGMSSVEGLTPLQTNIVPNGESVLGYVDLHPSIDEATYVVTAVDGAGNESLPSDPVYLNIDLLPVATLEVALGQSSYPEVSWSHTGSNIIGYNIYLGQDTTGVKLNSSLITDASYEDSGYNGGERYYTVTAIDENSKESVGRTIYLPDIELALNGVAQLSRGIMNRMQYQLHNAGSADVDGLQLQVDLDGHQHLSSNFNLTSGEDHTQPMVIGGFENLPDQITSDVLLRIEAATGEVVKLSSQELFTVGDDTPSLSVQAQDMVRGTAAQIRFEFSNTSDVDVELVAASNSGNQASDEIRIMLEDMDSNVLSVVPYHQATGSGIVTLSNKKTVARAASGATFTSGWIDLPIPENAPDDVVVRVVIDHQHYRVGEIEHVSIGGVQATQDAALTQTAYMADIQSVSPENSYGEEPIVITGRALDRTTQIPVPDTKIKLVIASNGFEREREVTTDETGAYSYSFTPLSGEAGIFKVSAIHPDMLSRPEQGQFIISKVSVTPQTLNLYLPYNVPKSFDVITATAATGTQASNLRMVHVPAEGESGLPDGVEITLTDPQDLSSGQKAKLPFTLSASSEASAEGSLTYHVLSDESGSDALAVITLNYKFSEAKPTLYFSPNYLETGVAHEGYTAETITLQNKGLAPMNDVNVQLIKTDGTAAPSWIHLTSSASIGTLAVGSSSAVNLALSPSNSIVEGVHEFMLRVSSSNHPVRDINIFASVTQDGIGGMLFKVSDIYTATLDEDDQLIEGLAGARIKVQNEAVLSIEESLTTDSKGEALFTNLPAGYYRFRASASNHQDIIGRFIIKPGITGAQDVFLEYNLVTVEWVVTETTIQDEYEITLHATFETDVPAAVVVIEPTSTQLPDMEPGEVFQGELRITNYGLIRAENFDFTLPGEDAYFRYEFPQGLPEILEAKESLTIPYRVTALQSTESDGTGGGALCGGYSGYMRAKYEFVCTNGQWSRKTVGHSWVRPHRGTECGSGSSSGSSWTGGGWGGGWGGGYSGGISYGSMPGAKCPKPCPSNTCAAGGKSKGNGGGK